ncbi:MAG: hypothetical protein U0822_16895 [Anaerolineae bacterium]
MDVKDMRPETETARARRPFWIVAVTLFAIVLVGLLAAYGLDRRFRAPVGVEPAPPGSASSQARAPGTPPTALPAAQPSAVVVAPTVAITPTLPAGLRLADSPLEREIEAAYLHYWQVLAEANLTLDTSRLPEVAADKELVQAQQQVNDLKAQGRAAKLDVEHRTAFAKVTPTQAVIADEYLNKSVFVDPVTKEELKTSSPPTVEKLSFTMRKIDGQWKVVEALRYD